jgi:hypothetical protein
MARKPKKEKEVKQIKTYKELNKAREELTSKLIGIANSYGDKGMIVPDMISCFHTAIQKALSELISRGDEHGRK